MGGKGRKSKEGGRREEREERRVKRKRRGGEGRGKRRGGRGSWTSQKSLFRVCLYREQRELPPVFLVGLVTPGTSSMQAKGSVTGSDRHTGHSLFIESRAEEGGGLWERWGSLRTGP